MFTGLVTAVGTVRRAAHTPAGLELTIDGPYADLETGESVAVDGACLTAQSVSLQGFTAHVIRTTVERTGFGGYAAGRRVNLERSLRVGDRMGGHIVQGHVDGLGVVERIGTRDDARLLDIRVPAEVAAATIPLGSITVDGVSLTVNAMPSGDVVQVSLIPFTLQATTLGERRTGDRVHLEGDTIGKYVSALMRGRPGS